MAKKKAGRPRGSTNKPRETVVCVLGTCPRCGSSKLGNCTQTKETAHNGERDGKAFTHIVRRWKRCQDCRQAVIEITYENRVRRSKPFMHDTPEEYDAPADATG